MAKKYYAIGLNDNNQIIAISRPQERYGAKWDVEYHTRRSTYDTWHKGMILKVIKVQTYNPPKPNAVPTIRCK